MQNNLLEKTKELCRIYGIHPARSKGQNFLINEDAYDRIVEASQLTVDDTVLEVGPGLGFLTAKLSKQVKKVIAVELDDILADYLGSAIKMQNVKNVEVINTDVMKIEVRSQKLEFVKNIPASSFQLLSSKYKIVANLPYNITSVFLRKFLSEAENKPEMMVLMLQKEVAERITAKPGEMSLLAISVQFYADAEIVGYVPKNDFWPAPEVDSAIIKLEVRSQKLEVRDEKDFFRLVKFGFTAKRKMLKNNLAAGYHISQSEAEKKIIEVGLDPKIRAQELSIDDWIRLVQHFYVNDKTR